MDEILSGNIFTLHGFSKNLFHEIVHDLLHIRIVYRTVELLSDGTGGESCKYHKPCVLYKSTITATNCEIRPFLQMTSNRRPCAKLMQIRWLAPLLNFLLRMASLLSWCTYMVSILTPINVLQHLLCWISTLQAKGVANSLVHGCII